MIHKSLRFSFFINIIECKRPLGMLSSGPPTSIKCGLTLPSDLSQCASSCADAQFNSNKYWCGVNTDFFGIKFEETVIVTGIAIRAACDDCKINKFLLDTKSPHSNFDMWRFYPDNTNPTVRIVEFLP